MLFLFFFFFFQAEDGIRDVAVTGVQTCALPISVRLERGGHLLGVILQVVEGIGLVARVQRVRRAQPEQHDARLADDARPQERAVRRTARHERREIQRVRSARLPCLGARLARGDARERRHHSVPHDRKYIRPMTESPVRRHHWIVRLTHWVTVVTLAGLIASGLQIYEAYARFGGRGGPFLPSPFDDTRFPAWSRLGGWRAGALNWHFALMWPLVTVGLGYLGYLVKSGEWRALLFRPRDVPGAVQMARYYLGLRKEHPPQGEHNPLQKLAYTSIYLDRKSTRLNSS